jgi:tetratricopeptide (TPR) repeat protein
MRKYSKALESFEKSLELKQATLPSDHPDLANTYNHIGLVHWNMGEYSKALPCYERAVEIGQRAFPQNHPYLLMYQQVLVEVKKKCNLL